MPPILFILYYMKAGIISYIAENMDIKENFDFIKSDFLILKLK